MKLEERFEEETGKKVELDIIHEYVIWLENEVNRLKTSLNNTEERYKELKDGGYE